MADLSDLRKKIDQLDYQIHDLLNERATLALKIADTKVEATQLHDFYRPERETQILQQITDYNKGPLSAQAIASIFKAIMKECLNIQEAKYPKS